ncbi:hypothetical protein [Acidovorax sp. FG27]|uniref:hypothetical protein n=1 Tax=Acidovorax sp. FG27 TaxID=3133652 RepID=UPI0030EA57DA
MTTTPTPTQPLAAVPEALRLADEYAEARHAFGCHTYNAKTAAARDALIAALSAAAPAPTTEQAAPVWNKLPYETPAELWKAFKAGAKFVLHYHGKTYPVERMQAQRTVCYVEPPKFPVKVYPDGRNCESAGDAIWLEQLAAPGGEAPAGDAVDEAALSITADELYRHFEIAGKVQGFRSSADLQEFLGSAIVHYMAVQSQKGAA